MFKHKKEQSAHQTAFLKEVDDMLSAARSQKDFAATTDALDAVLHKVSDELSQTKSKKKNNDYRSQLAERKEAVLDAEADAIAANYESLKAPAAVEAVLKDHAWASIAFNTVAREKGYDFGLDQPASAPAPKAAPSPIRGGGSEM